MTTGAPPAALCFVLMGATAGVTRHTPDNAQIVDKHRSVSAVVDRSRRVHERLVGLS
jgi:hypothetical protein